MKSIFYLAKCSISGGVEVFQRPPIKLVRFSDASICWSGSGGEKGRVLVCFYSLDKFIATLKQHPGTCMMIEVENEEDVAAIRVINRNMKCETSCY